MTLRRDLTQRFGRRTIKLDVEEETLALFLSLGWIKKFLGQYIITERGEHELAFLAGLAD